MGRLILHRRLYGSQSFFQCAHCGLCVTASMVPRGAQSGSLSEGWLLRRACVLNLFETSDVRVARLLQLLRGVMLLSHLLLR